MTVGAITGVVIAASIVAFVVRRSPTTANCDDASHAGRPHKPLPTTKEIAMLPPDGGPEFNRLVFEKSPYLLQHARNPVDWYPWGEEAFAKARAEGKPLFLSIGYSTCHWCHVMERESFENEALAKLLNAHFVPIKVDREERPDLDEIYMNATQLMTGSGGWPNSVFLDHDARPWYAGTYFPPEDSHGRPGFRSLLMQLSQIWRTRQADVVKQAEQLSGAIKRMSSGASASGTGDLSREVVGEAIRALRSSYDQRFGGFGGAPKFPPHMSFRLLFHEYRRTQDQALLEMATNTLDRMALGGIHDHVGGGFHRYSTDERWFLPHFEKMLYDNAQLAVAYVEAFRITGNQQYRRVAEGIYEWVLRDMTGDEGGFYSALDADSEGEEGKFYVWARDEVTHVLGKENGRLFCEVYGIDEDGNFRDEATRQKTGTSIPFLTKTVEQHAKDRGMPAGELRTRLADARRKLLAVRNERLWPHLDDKVLTAWNGLMIGAFAYGGQYLDERRYTAAAEKAANFALGTMRKDGRLLRTYRDGEAKLTAYLDDYTFLIDGLLTLHEATGAARWLDEAKVLAAVLTKYYADEDGGGFYFTASDHEDLLLRSKDPYDKAIPSGNGMASRVLLRLAHLTGEQPYYETTRNMLEAFTGLMEKAPRGTESLILTTAQYFDEDAPKARVAQATAEVGTPDAKARKKPVTLEAFASRSTVAPGGSLQVAVRLVVDDGWHVNSHQPLAENLMATSLSLSGGLSAKLVDVAYPKGKNMTFGFSQDPLSVYEGEVWLMAGISLGKDALAGEAQLDLTVSLQACNDHSCAPPQKLLLSIPLEVRPAAGGGETQHEALFERLRGA